MQADGPEMGTIGVCPVRMAWVSSYQELCRWIARLRQRPPLPQCGRPLVGGMPVRAMVRHLPRLMRCVRAVGGVHPAVRFVWIDIEDEAEVAGDLDVETFPTLLVADGQAGALSGALAAPGARAGPG